MLSSAFIEVPLLDRVEDLFELADEGRCCSAKSWLCGNALNSEDLSAKKEKGGIAPAPVRTYSAPGGCTVFVNSEGLDDLVLQVEFLPNARLNQHSEQ